MAPQKELDDSGEDVLVHESLYAGAEVQVFQHAQSVGSRHPAFYAVFARPEDGDFMSLVGTDLISVEAAVGAVRAHLDTLC